MASSLKPPRVFCVHFPAWWTHYLQSVSAAGPVQNPLSLLFLKLSGYYVNAVQLHVRAADVLVRCGVDREGFRQPLIWAPGTLLMPAIDGAQIRLFCRAEKGI